MAEAQAEQAHEELEVRQMLWTSVRVICGKNNLRILDRGWSTRLSAGLICARMVV